LGALDEQCFHYPAELLNIFDGVLRLEPLDADEAITVIREAAEVTDDVLQAAHAMLSGRTIPIKKLLTVVDMASQGAGEGAGRRIASAAAFREACCACGVDLE
jgi:hypothetical protein